MLMRNLVTCCQAVLKGSAMPSQVSTRLWGVPTGPAIRDGQQNPGLRTPEPYTAAGQGSIAVQAQPVTTHVFLLGAQTHVL